VSGRKEWTVVQLSDFNFYSCPEKRRCKLQIGVFRLLCCVRRFYLYECVYKYVLIYIYINLYSDIYTKTHYIITMYRVYCL